MQTLSAVAALIAPPARAAPRALRRSAPPWSRGRRDREVPARRFAHRVDLYAVVRWVKVSSLVSGSGSSTPRSVTTAVGPRPRKPSASRAPGPSPWPTVVRKSSCSTNVRVECGHDDDHLAAARGDLGRPPAPGRRVFGIVVVADHGGVEVGEAVDLGGAEERDVDPPGPIQ